ncbi:hypothetical protein BIW11_06675 [Tropilaelaps mercedesae]|uniref:Uncharacterized protein n=1 Tax=Tropilaelaps mercedesae TaxID=418985 RepID=A0A1V9XX15_9ACAR|nr:hypothetical protein BIW11_06675 [Tropilaelaps mercedesae]
MAAFWRTSGAPSRPPPDSGPPSMIPQHQSRYNRSYYRSSRDDFWNALSSNYNYLMDNQLVTACRKSNHNNAERGAASEQGVRLPVRKAAVKQGKPYLTVLNCLVAACAILEQPWPEVEADFSQHSPCPDEGMSSLGSSLPSLSLTGGPPSLSVAPLPPFIQGGSLVGLTPQQLVCRLAEVHGWLQAMNTKLEIEADQDRRKHLLKLSLTDQLLIVFQ